MGQSLDSITQSTSGSHLQASAEISHAVMGLEVKKCGCNMLLESTAFQECIQGVERSFQDRKECYAKRTVCIFSATLRKEDSRSNWYRSEKTPNCIICSEMRHPRWRRKEGTTELHSKTVSLGHNRSNMHGKKRKRKQRYGVVVAYWSELLTSS